MLQRRTSPRLRTLKAGKIVFNYRRSVIDCTIRNVSETGACVQVPSTAGIPEQFDLLTGAEGVSRTCRVVWTTETQIGVEFQ